MYIIYYSIYLTICVTLTFFFISYSDYVGNISNGDAVQHELSPVLSASSSHIWTCNTSPLCTGHVGTYIINRTCQLYARYQFLCKERFHK